MFFHVGPVWYGGEKTHKMSGSGEKTAMFARLFPTLPKIAFVCPGTLSSGAVFGYENDRDT